MFPIDYPTLRVQVGFANHIATSLRDSSKEKEEAIGDVVTLRSRIVMDAVVYILNDKENNPGASYSVYVKDHFDGELEILELGNIVLSMVDDIKRKFYLAGFDPRLRYKLMERGNGRLKTFTVIMDLYSTFMFFDIAEESEDVTQIVSDNPSPELLNELFGSGPY